MKNNAILTIFKKELARFFKDKRTLVALLMPGILIYIIYSIMGGFMGNAFMPDEDYVPTVRTVGMPESLRPAFVDSEYFDVTEFSTLDNDELQMQKELVSNAEIDLLIIFPDDFDEKISGDRSGKVPNVEIFYNSSEANSSTAYQMAYSILDAFESQLANILDVNASADTTYDLASEESITGMIFSMLMPMLLIMLLFSGCMAVAPESIAGEKERGTIATLLITPTKRSHIAIGKILALSIMALISGASSTLGTLLSLPKLMGGTVELDGAAYGIADYAMLAVVILSTVLVFITLIAIVSAYAKTVKEAGTYLTPLMILAMLVGLSGMAGGATTNPALYLIPIFNSVQSMISIFSFDLNIVNVIITVCANIAVTALGVFILTRMFNSEKIMFNK